MGWDGIFTQLHRTRSPHRRDLNKTLLWLLFAFSLEEGDPVMMRLRPQSVLTIYVQSSLACGFWFHRFKTVLVALESAAAFLAGARGRHAPALFLLLKIGTLEN